MAKTRSQKASEVSAFVEALHAGKSVIFADLSSVKVNDANKFRRAAEKESISVNLTKKTLLTLALKEAGISAVDMKSLNGSVSMVVGLEDAVAPAKALEALRKDFEGVKVMGGLLDGVWMDAAQVKALAALPSKQELLGQVVATINAPISGFVNVLAGNLRNLVTVLGAIKDAKAA